MAAYDHKKIEEKWQKKWEETQAFKAPDNPKNKLYVLDMFPYPSGAGLHVGHVEGYTATDVYSRFKRMQGYDVLHPMGWDAFGLPAENYAVKTGIPPAKTTNDAIAAFTKQIKSLGLSYDWSREFGTHTPEYYKWTQWLFLFLYKNGLAEKKLSKVNWCPKDQTVLANEQVVNGACERCGTAVVQKDLEQWFLKITEYADQLVDDLDTVDWPESTKINQRNWIGRSEGAEIDFALAGRTEKIKVFTTRPDTIFGATYCVLAPEHPLVQKLAESASNKAEIAAYVEATRNKTDLERQEGQKDKTGVEIKGIKAVNPANKEEIPVWISDFVLGTYGTGALMAVPAHDERDMEFAKKFNLPVKEIELEDPKVITKQVGGQWVKKYRLRDWLISRQRYWGAPIPVVYDPAGKPHPVPEEHLPWLLPTDVEFKPTGTSPLGQSKELLERTEKIFGKGWTPEVDTMDTFMCSSWYFFRFADPHNDKEFASKEAMQKWLPVDLYVGGAEHTVLHLMYARFFTKVLQKHGFIDFNEPFQKLRHQGTILAEDGTKMSKSKGNVINPDDVIATYGADTLRLYEMFMGPFEAMKPWNTNNILGVRRFLERVWRLGNKLHSLTPQERGKSSPEDFPMSAAVAATNIPSESPVSLDVLVHQTIKKVTDDIEGLKFNTAISALMILLNTFEEAKTVSKEAYETFVQLLAPFAPHMASELAEAHQIDLSAWPKADVAKLAAATVPVAVQVNGKLRATLELSTSLGEKEALEAARADQHVQKWLALGKEVKAVYVPGKVINFVVRKV
jgi:leucyl-tRNA synthetase